MKRWFRLFYVGCFLLGLLVLMVSITPLVSIVARRMPVDWYQGDADVLVVLGGSMLVDGTDAQATLGYDSYLRCTYASWNMLQHHYKFVVLSGSDGLAQAMASYLLSHGAKAQQLLIEDSAHTTLQNAEFVKKILDHQPGLPPRPLIAVLTSDYHTRRARRVFEHVGLSVRVIPAPDVLKRAERVLLRWGAFLDLSRELVKFGYYKATGKV